MMSLTTTASAEGWDQQVYDGIISRIKAPAFRSKYFSITEFGASTNASAAKNQKAINKAIATCSKQGGGRVVVPAGLYMTGAITLKSNVNLVIEEGATLRFAFDRDLYPNVETRWEGLNIINYQPCIYAVDAENIGITLKGHVIIDLDD